MPRPSRLDRVILFVGLLICFGFIAGQTIFRVESIRHVDNASPVPPELLTIPGIHPRHIPLPAASIDSDWWIMHTEDMLRTGDWRVRETARDNAPEGREVHWSSCLMWLLAGISWLLRHLNGLTAVDNVQNAAVIAGPLMLGGFITVLALVSARRWGGATGAFVALALTTLGPADSLFRPGEADHHGIVMGFALGCTLAALAAGAGRVSRAAAPANPRGLMPGRTSARRWMILSGLLGSAGLWVSAATIVPALAGIALGALLATWLGRGHGNDPDTEAAPDLWRVWGVAGAAGSLGFYLLEYAPNHFGWRLEVNHPLHALAWLGGGDLLARACSWLSNARFAPTARQRLVAVSSLAGLLALPTVIKFGGTKVFNLQDPFLWNLHAGHIYEFQPLARILGSATRAQIAATTSAWPLLGFPVAWFILRRRLSPGSVAPLALALGATLPLTGLALYQVRWFPVSQALWLGLATVVFVLWRSAATKPARWLTCAGSTVVVAGLGLFPLCMIPRWRPPEGFSPDDAHMIVMRNIAWKLRIAMGSNPINILGGPATTTCLAFFGDTRAVGTLYWENLAGLKTAGAIFGAQNDADALRLCRDHAVTHIVLFSWNDFAGTYARLHHGREEGAATSDCFADRIFDPNRLPVWLSPLAYAMPDALARSGQWVRILEFRPEQSAAEAQYHLGVYFNDEGRHAEALAAFTRSWNLDNTSADTGWELARSLVAADRADEARQVADFLPVPNRVQLLRLIGRRLAADGDYRAAAATARQAVELAPADRETITDLAWLLATADDPAVRDGLKAFALMNKLASQGQALTLREIDALAAALAETGDFAQALELVNRVLDELRKQPASGPMLHEFEVRRAFYAASRPFRIEAEPKH